MTLKKLVCDICKDPPPNDLWRKYEGKVICSMACWLEMWKLEWSRDFDKRVQQGARNG